jgi:hypothetical protein
MSEDLGSRRQVFGYEVFGPIMAEFCQRLWLYDRFTPDPEDRVLLFCARGGLRLQSIYERFIQRMHLKTRIESRSFMVSRLVAARAGFADPGAGLQAELEREFSGRPMSEVANALAQEDLEFPEAWHQPFNLQAFTGLLRSGDFEAEHVKAKVANQDRMFRLYLADILQGRKQAILCDTGLYGSTLRLLSEGIPEIRWSCVQFARCNYKGLPTPHFGRTHGLSVQSDGYVPWDPRTSTLRFWQLIEAMLEPPLQSVRSFEFPHGDETPRCNLEVDGWNEQLGPGKPDIYSGALAYIDDLSPKALPNIERYAAGAWRNLKRAIIWPDEDMVAVLELGDRSRDFGRLEQVAQFAPTGEVTTKRAAVSASLWREGAIRRIYPAFGGAWLVGLEVMYTLRAMFKFGKWQLTTRLFRHAAPSVDLASAPDRGVTA